MAWLRDLSEKGNVTDPGHPLERSGKLVSGKARTVTDGPFAEAKDVVGGYTLLQAADLGQATALARSSAERTFLQRRIAACETAVAASAS
jgi:hypothetical protein